MLRRPKRVRQWMALSLLVLCACRREETRGAREPADEDLQRDGDYSIGDRECVTLVPKERGCTQTSRAVRAWGPTPRALPPAPTCPMRVHLLGDGVVAEPLPFENNFEPLPFPECVAAKYAVGGRRVHRVDDGYFVAYDGLFHGELFWASEDGRRRQRLASARIAGFARTSSGGVLALAIGRARLGRGGVLALERDDEGWRARLIATLPIEPSPVGFDDHGVLVGFGQGFVFRVDERGRVQNVHYFARQIGRVSSIARAESGIYFLGLECGVVRLMPDIDPEGRAFYREEWWSSRTGASGRWPSCAMDP